MTSCGPQRHEGVAADRGMAGVVAGHQATARRGADGAAGVALREAHALRGQAVEVRRLDLLLAVAAEVAIAQVVGQDENDVGRSGRIGRDGPMRKEQGEGGRGERKEMFRHR